MIDDSIQPSGEEFENVASTQILAQVEREEAGRIRVHNDPRISTNQLAEYIISNPSRQRQIIREAKFASIVLTVPYKKTRDFIRYAFDAESLNIDRLIGRAQEIERDNERGDISNWIRSDNERSALALREISKIAPDLSWRNGRIILGKPGGLLIWVCK